MPNNFDTIREALSLGWHQAAGPSSDLFTQALEALRELQVIDIRDPQYLRQLAVHAAAASHTADMPPGRAYAFAALSEMAVKMAHIIEKGD